jgi:hypothetical protein
MFFNVIIIISEWLNGIHNIYVHLYRRSKCGAWDMEETWPKPEKRGRRMVLAFLRMMLMYSALSYYIISCEYYTGCLGRTIHAHHVLLSLYSIPTNMMWPKRMENFRISLFPFWWEIGIMLFFSCWLIILASVHFTVCAISLWCDYISDSQKDIWALISLVLNELTSGQYIIAMYFQVISPNEQCVVRAFNVCKEWRDLGLLRTKVPKRIIRLKCQPFVSWYPIQMEIFWKI